MVAREDIRLVNGIESEVIVKMMKIGSLYRILWDPNLYDQMEYKISHPYSFLRVFRC